MTENDEFKSALKLAKTILSSISISFCLLLIIIYFISCLQIKCSIFAKKEIETLEDKRGSFLDKTSIHSSKNKNKTKKIGLGSHYIFFLILSNLLSGIVEIISIFFGDTTDKCELIGFAHNFFDLSSVCWTSMLALLFYNSTKITSQMFFKDKKYLIIGIAYTLISCIIFCVIPYYAECFGMATTYCTFYQLSEVVYKKDKIRVGIFKYIFVFFSFINTIYNIFCFHRTTRFYSTKLSLLKKQNLKEYVLVLIFVRVFQLFSITLIVSRLIKFSCMVMLDIVNKDDIENSFIIKGMIFLNAVIFDLNGTFNSIASIFFFRGVFWCCISTESDVRNVENNEEDLEEKKEGVEYSDKDSINGK